MSDQFQSHEPYQAGRIRPFTAEAKERIGALADLLEPLEAQLLSLYGKAMTELTGTSRRSAVNLLSELDEQVDVARQEFENYIPAIAEATGNSAHNVRMLLLKPIPANGRRSGLNDHMPAHGTPSTTLRGLLSDGGKWEVPATGMSPEAITPQKLICFDRICPGEAPGVTSTRIEHKAAKLALERFREGSLEPNTTVWASVNGSLRKIDSPDDVDWAAKPLLQRAIDASKESSASARKPDLTA